MVRTQIAARGVVDPAGAGGAAHRAPPPLPGAGPGHRGLRRPSPAHRPRPDHLPALHRGPRRRRWSCGARSGCWRWAPAAARWPRCWPGWPERCSAWNWSRTWRPAPGPPWTDWRSRASRCGAATAAWGGPGRPPSTPFSSAAPRGTSPPPCGTSWPWAGGCCCPWPSGPPTRSWCGPQDPGRAGAAGPAAGGLRAAPLKRAQ